MNNIFYNLLVSNGLKPKKILHVGANRGQEVGLYHDLNIDGWHIEAIPSIYEEFLVTACKKFQNQYPINACLSDSDGKYVEFNIASNQGQSSSILDLGRHSVAYPSIKYEQKLKLKTKTIDRLIEENIIPEDIDFLLIDAQGAEALILDGAKRLLESGSLMACQIETAVIPLYKNGATYLDISQKLLPFGFYLRHCVFNADGWTDALFMRAYWPQIIPLEGDWSLKTINIMRPKSSPFPLIRVGGNKDGSYLLPNDLKGIKICFSPGVSNRKDFEDELVDNYGIICHMCDYSSDIDLFKTPLKPRLQTFKKKWLDIDGGQDSISLESWVNELAPDINDDLILQMDIEGAEYRNLLNTREEILKRFRIIVIELHGLMVCNNPELFNKELGQLLRLLDKFFICVHAHPNNCCGSFDFMDSGLNIPNVHELTFLRRDRWQVNSGNLGLLIPPLLPHPLDIVNMQENPPLFLNEAWLESGIRSPESTIKVLEDKVSYLTQELKRTIDSNSSVVLQLHQLAQQINNAIIPLQNMDQMTESKLNDLVVGKHFILSSSYNSSYPNQGVVEKRNPFFFHTGYGNNQSITIDLEIPCQLFELVVGNRTDMCKDRARCLFYVMHDKPEAHLTEGFPLAIDQEFLTGTGLSRTDLKGKISRYITIFSPENTCLHFSSIEVFGKLYQG